MIGFTRKKLRFEFAKSSGTISLTEALKGRAGTVHLGSDFDGSVYLWTPTTKEILSEEAVCDLRFEALSPTLYQKFEQASKSKLLPAKCALFKGKNPAKIAEALQYFDYIIIPNPKLKNDWECLYKTHVLGYQPRNIKRLMENTRRDDF